MKEVERHLEFNEDKNNLFGLWLATSI